MIIERIRLVNIKSFADQEMHFLRGINIIAGRNGAGKSTVLEAIGLALFDAWPPRFRDGNAQVGFLRRGADEGSISVTVTAPSGRYHIDCTLGQRKRKGKDPTVSYERVLTDDSGQAISHSAGRKEEFQEDMRRYVLGAARIGDDRLFKDIIGTEQGTFDEPFTRVEGERRELFERILGIADFQKFERQFGALVRMHRTATATARTKAGEHQDAPGDLAREEEQLRMEIALRDAAREAQHAAAAAVMNAQSALEALRLRMDARLQAGQALELAELALANARGQREGAARRHAAALDATRMRDESAVGHAAYERAESELANLRVKAAERDVLERAHVLERAAHESAVAFHAASLKAARDGAAALEPQLAALKNEVAASEAAGTESAARAASIGADLALCERDLTHATALQQYSERMLATHRTITDAGAQADALRTELGVLEMKTAALGTDFPDALAVTVLPIVKERAEALFSLVASLRLAPSTGTDDGNFLPRLSAIVSQLETKARELRSEEREVVKEGASHRAHARALADQMEQAGRELAAAHAQIDDLVREGQDLQQKGQAMREMHGRAVAPFAGIDDAVADRERLLQKHRAEHERYQKVVQEAATLDACAAELAAAAASESEAIEAVHRARSAQQDADALVSEDAVNGAAAAAAEAVAAERVLLADAERWKSSVQKQEERVELCRVRLRKYEELQRDARRAHREEAFVTDVHTKVLRGLAQGVGSSIVASVSAFADELFRRIAPEQRASLIWDPQTYGIELHADTAILRGKELSGGQLMGVSLAVKLALIKWYAQCRIGFLDEPTTHLDQDTRRHLASVIAALNDLTSDGAWFDQLFVISHEESFTGTGHRIELERNDNAESVVVSAE